MKFKKLEIHGFKSFADKLEVNFDSGITGIVGPNGCGKSNVADSIRWVMGEQSAKSMRGSSMQDVIFNGTELRKPESYCEVALYFDNAEKIFPLDYSEVVLSRKLYRSGESEYAINKNPVRLKDILDTLRDSGLGRDSYCVIGQGKIDSLISAKPEDRRTIFEEAAGISRFKSRKIEAERKLERTQDNLTRINDIIFELEKQIEPLSKQSANAKKFLELKEQLKSLEVNIYIAQYDSASTNKAEIATLLTGIGEELAQKQKDFEKALSEYDESVSNINELDEKIAVLRDELLELTVALEKKSGEAKLVQEKVTNLEEQNKKLNLEISQDEVLQESLKGMIDEKTKSISKTKSVLEELERQISKVNDEYLAVVDRITAGEVAANESGDEILNATSKLGDVKSSLSSLTAEKNVLTEKQTELETKKVELETEKKKLEETKSQLDKKLEKLESERNSVKAEIAERNSQLEQAQELGTKLSKKLEDEKANYHSNLSKARILQEMQEDNEGYVISVKRLLEQAKNNENIGKRVVGVVAKLMQVPQQYEVAIEFALGASVQNIVTKNDEDTKYLVNYLKQNNFGRATFLPISEVKERSVPDYVRSKMNMAGVLGVASELVKFDKAYLPIFNHLLGGTVIVDTLSTAVTLSQKTGYVVKVVTLDGDIINPSGAVTGGSRKETSTNLISREREIKDLMSKLESEKTEIEEIEKKIAKLQEKQSSVNDIVLKLNSTLHEKEIEIGKEEEKCENLEYQINDVDKECRNAGYSIEALLDRLEIIDKKIGETSREQDEISEEKSKATSAKIEQNSRFDMLKKQRETLYETITDLKVKRAQAEANLESGNSDLERFSSDLAVSNYRYRENKLSLQKNLTSLSEYQEILNNLSKESAYSENMKKLQETRDKLANMDNYKNELQAKMNDADSKKMQLSSEIQRVSDKKLKEEMRLASIDTDIETMQERVWEEYGLTYASAQEFKLTDFDLQNALTQSGKVKRQIQALGFVNVNAIEDLKLVQERYDDMSTQRNDLETAEKDLTKIIKELTSEMENKFKTQFDKINANFQKIFTELFGGGKAELSLDTENGVSLLECGIDIKAEPPGKKLQSITLLSGGEKALTAIAILFAILKLSPMPFCVLDEIEAALDDANVERFARYLQRFSKDTQFIVITHRKPTMELADCLYGVTMEEKGVSKMVSVKLSDAVKQSTEGK